MLRAERSVLGRTIGARQLAEEGRYDGSTGSPTPCTQLRQQSRRVMRRAVAVISIRQAQPCTSVYVQAISALCCIAA